MSSIPAHTVTTTTLPNGTRQVITVITLPNGTRTTSQLIPSLPVVTTETTHHADGSGSTVRETTTIIHPGGQRKATIIERFVPVADNVETDDGVPISSSMAFTFTSPDNHDTVASSSIQQDEIGGQVEVEAREDDSPQEVKDKPAEEEPATFEEPSDRKSENVPRGDDNTTNTTASKNERDSESASTAKFRSGWSSTPKVPKVQMFIPTIDPRETMVQRRRREENKAREAATQREKEEDACRLAEENAAERLEQERLTVEAEAERLEQEKMAVAAAARQAEVEILVNQAELDRLEQERIERERALTEQRQAAMAVSVAAPMGNNGLKNAEEGIVEHSASAVAEVKAVEEEGVEETTEPEKRWWQNNKCRCTSLLLLLLIAGGVAGLVIRRNNGNGTAAEGIAPMASGGDSLDGTEAEGVAPMASDGDSLDGTEAEGVASMGSVLDSLDGTEAEGVAPMASGGDSLDDAALIPLIVDRSCEYRKSQSIYVSVSSNGVDNMMYGGMSDFDGNNAVVTSNNEDGIGAVWVLSKDAGGSWGQTAFQTDGGDQFGWDVAISGETIVTGAPAYEGRDIFYPTLSDSWWGGSGVAFVLMKNSNGEWYTQATLLPQVADFDASFGISVDISECGCFIAVGAWHDRDGRGSVYVFSRTSSGSWTEAQKLSPSFRQTHSDFFHGNYGHSVVISDTLLAVKAPFDYINGIRGVVYLYKRGSDGKYDEIERLSTPEGQQTESYHAPQIALLDEFVLVGAHEYNKVYVFRQTSSGVYQKTTELTASDAKSGTNFGIKIGGQGTDVLVADRGDDSTYLFSYEGGVWKEKAKFDGYHAALSDKSIVVHSPFDFRMNGSSYSGQVSFYDLICEPV